MRITLHVVTYDSQQTPLIIFYGWTQLSLEKGVKHKFVSFIYTTKHILGKITSCICHHVKCTPAI